MTHATYNATEQNTGPLRLLLSRRSAALCTSSKAIATSTALRRTTATRRSSSCVGIARSRRLGASWNRSFALVTTKLCLFFLRITVSSVIIYKWNIWIKWLTCVAWIREAAEGDVWFLDMMIVERLTRLKRGRVKSKSCRVSTSLSQSPLRILIFK